MQTSGELGREIAKLCLRAMPWPILRDAAARLLRMRSETLVVQERGNAARLEP